MFQNLNPLDKPTAFLEIIIMLVIAALLGYLIGHLLQKLQKDKLKSELRFADDKYLTLNNRFGTLEKENREFEALIGDLRNRKSSILQELEEEKKATEKLSNKLKSGNLTTVVKNDNEEELKALILKVSDLKKENETLTSALQLKKGEQNDELLAELKATINKLKDDNLALEQMADKEAQVISKLKTKVNQLEQGKTTESKDKITPAQKVVSTLSEAKETSQPTTTAKGLSLEAYKIKKLALFQSIGSADESEKESLTEINGIGPLIEAKLNTLGIFTYKQIANFSKKDTENVTDLIEFFPGRITRDNWIQQAKDLVENNKAS